MPRAGHWLEEAGRSRSDGSNNVQDLSMMGHVVMVGSPYHNSKGDKAGENKETKVHTPPFALLAAH